MELYWGYDVPASSQRGCSNARAAAPRGTQAAHTAPSLPQPAASSSLQTVKKHRKASWETAWGFQVPHHNHTCGNTPQWAQAGKEGKDHTAPRACHWRRNAAVPWLLHHCLSMATIKPTSSRRELSVTSSRSTERVCQIQHKARHERCTVRDSTRNQLSQEHQVLHRTGNFKRHSKGMTRKGTQSIPVSEWEWELLCSSKHEVLTHHQMQQLSLKRWCPRLA